MSECSCLSKSVHEVVIVDRLLMGTYDLLRFVLVIVGSKCQVLAFYLVLRTSTTK